MKIKLFRDVITGSNRHRRVNLYVTGGGYHSARTAGMLAALNQKQWQDNFHYYIGQSSGSFSLMFLLSGGAVRGAAGYWKALPQAYHSRVFVNPWNLLNPFRPVMNLQYLVDVFFEKQNPIVWQKIIDNRINQEGRFLIQVMDAQTGGYKYLGNFQTVTALKQAIMASSWIPLLASRRPFQLSATALTEMAVHDEQFQKVDLELLETYDGQLTNSFFAETIIRLNTDLHLVCSNVCPGTETERFVNPFGLRFRVVERVMSNLLFYSHPKAVKTYQNSMIDFGLRRDFETLCRESADERSSVLGVFPDRYVDYKKVDDKTMRQAVLAGWRGMYQALGLSLEEEPESWKI